MRRTGKRKMMEWRAKRLEEQAKIQAAATRNIDAGPVCIGCGQPATCLWGGWEYSCADCQNAWGLEKRQVCSELNERYGLARDYCFPKRHHIEEACPECSMIHGGIPHAEFFPGN